MRRRAALILGLGTAILLIAGCRPAAPATIEATAVAGRPADTAAPATAPARPTDTAIPTAPPAKSTQPPTARPTTAPSDTPKATGPAARSWEARALALAGEVDAGRLMADVRWLADDARRGRLIGSPEEDEAGAWIGERFKALGLEPFGEANLDNYVYPFDVPAMIIPGRGGDSGRATGENYVAILPGTQQPATSYVYLTAHYDGLGMCQDNQVCNGADDDATGVAAVLEAARIMAGAAERPAKTVVFVAFSGEEIGLWGSAAWCQQLATAGQSSPGLVLNLEVLGALKGQGTAVDVWDEDRAETDPLAEAADWAGQALGVRVNRRGRDPGSDALVLNGCGLAAVSLDAAYSPQTHPYMHTPADDADEIDVDGFYNAVRVAVAAAWRLANDEPEE